MYLYVHKFLVSVFFCFYFRCVMLGHVWRQNPALGTQCRWHDLSHKPASHLRDCFFVVTQRVLVLFHRCHSHLFPQPLSYYKYCIYCTLNADNLVILGYNKTSPITPAFI